ncbi:MAG: hypothetical protein QOE45_254 [Frankiaceae bacterium]|jgi:three-Cys-motif partner protein|nr:hypothetical protein [Frankiaceae bacterium]
MSRRDRTWGYWTEQKLGMLAEYLPAFTTASQRARTTLYLDLFAGDVANTSRVTGEEIDGSPRVALNATPPLSVVRLFELPGQAERLEAQLHAEYPGRDLKVYAGDCNQTIDQALADLAQYNWAPTFALVDQYAAEIRWDTLAKLAAFKRLGKPKVELWLLFAASMLPRGLGGDDFDAIEAFADRITEMYGTQDWREAYEGRVGGLLSGGELRDELANLMRWRIENDLGYSVTHSFEMRNTRGTPLYSMIFATDHDAGNKIMRHIYGRAAERQPQMRAEAVARAKAAREAREGKLALFEPLVPQVKATDLYVHIPPNEPYRLPDK